MKARSLYLRDRGFKSLPEDYQTNMMKICEYCGKEHDGFYGSGRFCSCTCAKGFSTKDKRVEINEKIRKTVSLKSIPKIKKKCVYCGNEFETAHNRIDRKYCSISCSRSAINKLRFSDKAERDQVSIIMKLSYINGRQRGIGGRTKRLRYKNISVQGSYELRTCKILDEWKNIGKISEWEYTNDRIQYIDAENKLRTYLLDFKVYNIDGSFYYIEVKGWVTANDYYKWESVRKMYRLDVWLKEDIMLHENELNIKYIKKSHDWK